MKRLSLVLSLLLMATVLLTSCMKSDNDDATLYDDAAISTFTLGTLYRYYHPASDPTTTVRATVTGSLYPMTIDHLQCRIYNQDSLPVGTVPHVLCTVSAKNSGLVGLRPLLATNDTLPKVFNSNDSVDFSEPRIFRVLSTDGSFVRDYTVTLNIAKSTGTTFAWTKTGDLTLPAALDKCRLIMLNGKLMVLANRNVAVRDSFVYQLQGQDIYRSKDTITWEQVAATTPLKHLLAVGTKELFGIDNKGSIVSSRDNGNTWNTDSLDNKTELLPDSNLACVTFPYASAKNTDYVLLGGTRVDTLSKSPLDTKVVSSFWRRISYYDRDVKESKWVMIPIEQENRFMLPDIGNLSMACYQNMVLVMGKDKKVYQSADQGITWKVNTTLSLPATATGESAAIVNGASDELWAVTSTGEVWCGFRQ